MAQNFPYQFAGNLQKWVGRWDELPVDQHMLIALCAPRAVYITGGLTDQWSDPKGEFLALVAAGPVYRLLGAKDLGVSELPPLDRPVTGGDLGFHYHSGGHTASRLTGGPFSSSPSGISAQRETAITGRPRATPRCRQIRSSQRVTPAAPNELGDGQRLA